MAEPLTPLSYQYLSPQVRDTLQAYPQRANFASSFRDRTVPQVPFSSLQSYQPMSYSVGSQIPPPSVSIPPVIDYSRGTTFGSAGAPSLGQPSSSGSGLGTLGAISGAASAILGPVGMIAGIAGTAYSIYEAYQAKKEAKAAAKKQEEAQARYEAEDKRRYDESMALTMRQQRNAEEAASNEERRADTATQLGTLTTMENLKTSKLNRYLAKQRQSMGAMANAMVAMISQNNSMNNRLANSQMWRR